MDRVLQLAGLLQVLAPAGEGSPGGILWNRLFHMKGDMPPAEGDTGRSEGDSGRSATYAHDRILQYRKKYAK